MVQRPSSAFMPNGAQRAQRRAFASLLAAPRSVRHKLGGGHVVDGGPLDPDIALGLKVLSRIGGAELDERAVADARSSLAEESWMFAGAHTAVSSAHRVTIDGAAFGADGDIPAMLYLPERNPVTVQGKHAETPTAPDSHAADAAPSNTTTPDAARSGNVGIHDAPGNSSEGPLPLVIYFHGGGWVLGDAHTHDAVARALCAGAEVAVLNVDYRLAPEHVFPAAVDDAVAAFRWAHTHACELGIDPNRIAVAGDSAGGNLAAVVAQTTARDGGATPAMQMLFVPVTDITLPRSHSYETFSEGYFLTRANMDWYEANYLGGSSTPPSNIDDLRADPRVSPLRADDLPALAASGLAPAYVAVAGFDPLRDEGIAYARALREAGVPTSLRVHTDAVHPFINILATDLGRRCMAEAVGALRMGLRV